MVFKNLPEIKTKQVSLSPNEVFKERLKEKIQLLTLYRLDLGRSLLTETRNWRWRGGRSERKIKWLREYWRREPRFKSVLRLDKIKEDFQFLKRKVVK